MKKAYIIGASKIKDVSFLKKRNPDSYIVACDGGYKVLKKENIEPDLFVGDFDTLDEEALCKPKKTIKLNVVKDDTDTIFAIKECLKIGIDTFYLFGCCGGKNEHFIANIQVLKYLKKNHANGYLVDDIQKQILFVLQDESIKLKPINQMISVFSLSDECRGVTLKNLMYQLEDATLTNSFPLGISNQFIKGKTAFIEVKEGCLLIIAPIDSLLI